MLSLGIKCRRVFFKNQGINYDLSLTTLSNWPHTFQTTGDDMSWNPALKPLFTPSQTLFVLGSPLSVASCMFHSGVGYRGALLTTLAPSPSLLGVLLSFPIQVFEVF